MQIVGRLLQRYFQVQQCQSNLSQEFRAGFTTFTALAYILMVNPLILGDAIEPGNTAIAAQLLTTTALAAAFGSILMGIYANLPFALAPGMGLNAYFTYTVVLGSGLSWQAALGAVFLSGCIFLLISATGIRRQLVFAIPASIRSAAAAGVGLFIAFLGFKSAGLIAADPVTFVRIAPLSQASVAVFAIGLILTIVLMHFKIKGAILIGILISSLIAILGQWPVFHGQAFQGDLQIFAAPVWPSDLIGALTFSDAFEMGIVGIVFVFLFVDLFDTTGSLFALNSQLEDTHPVSESILARSFGVDALATIFGAWLGTSSTTTYIESATGIEDGGRTGLTAVMVGLLFLVSIFFWPVLKLIPEAATAPALVVVGSLMGKQVSRIPWDDLSEALPAFLCFLLMPLTFSIANGIAIGLLSYTALKVTTGRWRQLHPILVILSLLLVLRYLYVGS